MLITELPKRRSKKKLDVVVAKPPLSPEDMQALRDFVRFALGDGHLTSWEENFLNHLKHLLYRPALWISARQQTIIRQIKDKLHYDRQDVPLPPIDPDGVDANDDPDGWPVANHVGDQFEDDELVACLTDV